MIRLKVSLNSSRSGVLYHFTDSLNKVEDIVEHGLRTSSEYQSHMRKASPDAKNKTSRAYAENPKSAYISFTRSPSLLPTAEFSGMTWEYGVVFSADRLSDIAKMSPYNFQTSDRFISYSAAEYDDSAGGFAIWCNLYDWEASITATGKEPEGETPYDKLVDALQKLSRIPNCPIKVTKDDNVWTFKGNISEGFPFSKLPRYLQDLLGKADFQAEDRAFFPNKKTGEYIPETKKAIIGVIVPDNKYHQWYCKEFREKHPDITMYVYHNPVPDYAKSWYETEEPVPKDAYRQPIA